MPVPIESSEVSGSCKSSLRNRRSHEQGSAGAEGFDYLEEDTLKTTLPADGGSLRSPFAAGGTGMNTSRAPAYGQERGCFYMLLIRLKSGCFIQGQTLNEASMIRQKSISS